MGLLCCAVEATLWIGGGIGGWMRGGGLEDARRAAGFATVRLRALLVDHAGFWPGLLDDWTPNYPGQAAAMFLLYSVVHAGPAHLAGNMGALAWLGPGVARAVGGRVFLALWALCAAAGGLVFAALSTAPTPMVGASGALFGLLGAEAVLRFKRDGRIDERTGARARGRMGGRAVPRPWIRLGGMIVLFVVLNALSFALAGGRLAWQAHLGGFLAGLAAGAALPIRDPRSGLGPDS